MRVFAISDIHVDYPDNLAWIESLSDGAFQGDVLVLAGDVTDRLDLFRRAVGALADKFGRVFFTPGNHDLWVRKSLGKAKPGAAAAAPPAATSLVKLRQLLALCAELGVLTTPARIGRVWVVPILAWYHASFDTEPDIDLGDALQPVHQTMSDFFLCRWREAGLDPLSDSVAASLDAMNDDYAAHFPGFGELAASAAGAVSGGTPPRLPLAQVAASLAEVGADVRAHSGGGEARVVLSFSHFLPQLALCPEKRFLYYPHLPKAVGSAFLQRRVEALRPDVHVFGHTHFGWDGEVGGTRYVQPALAYPSERVRRLPSLKVGESWPVVPAPRSRGASRERPSPLLLAEVASGGGGGGNASVGGDRAAGAGVHLPRYTALWSQYYEDNARTPDDLVLAPWVRKQYVGVPGFREPAAAAARAAKAAARATTEAAAAATATARQDEAERDRRDGGPGVTAFFANKLKVSDDGGGAHAAAVPAALPPAPPSAAATAATAAPAAEASSDSDDEWASGAHGF